MKREIFEVRGRAVDRVLVGTSCSGTAKMTDAALRLVARYDPGDDSTALVLQTLRPATRNSADPASLIGEVTVTFTPDAIAILQRAVAELEAEVSGAGAVVEA